MSRTMQRNGSRVELALAELSQDGDLEFWHWFPARVIARRAGVSKPTAVKYLRILEESGCADRVERGNCNYWRVVRDNS